MDAVEAIGKCIFTLILLAGIAVWLNAGHGAKL